MEVFPHQPRWRFDDLMIDELNQIACRKIKDKDSYKTDKITNNMLDTEEINNLM